MKSKVIALDTMNLWIDIQKNKLDEAVSNIQLLFLNDAEAQMYSQEKGKKDGTSKLVKSIIPKFNSLNMFEVSETSWHQVSEILTDIQRLTLTGWYHV